MDQPDSYPENIMGHPTGYTIKSVRRTGHGSDRYGSCEVCGKHMPEAFVHQSHAVFVDADGDLYLSQSSAGLYAHMECGRLHNGARVVSLETLKRKANKRIYPDSALVADIMTTGVSEQDATQAVQMCKA